MAKAATAAKAPKKAKSKPRQSAWDKGMAKVKKCTAAVTRAKSALSKANANLSTAEAELKATPRT